MPMVHHASLIGVPHWGAECLSRRPLESEPGAAAAPPATARRSDVALASAQGPDGRANLGYEGVVRAISAGQDLG